MNFGLLVLADEIHLVRKSVEALRLLAEAATSAPRMDDGPSVSVVVGLAVLVGERLKLLERAARDTVDPLLLVGHHNAAVGNDEGGARLKVWDDARKRVEAERDIRRLDFQKKLTRRRRR